MESAWAVCKQAVLTGKGLDSEKFPTRPEVLDVGKKVSDRCRKAFDEDEQKRKEADLSDEHLSRIARYTDGFPLQNYVNMFGLVPELVNIVTLAEAIPVKGSGVTLPLDLHYIASRTSNSYFAPRRCNCPS
jgi:hypothetical protein